MENLLTKNDLFGAANPSCLKAVRASTRRYLSAARKRTAGTLSMCGQTKQRSNRPKEPPKTEGACANCRFAKELHGVHQQMYICRHKKDAQRSWWRVDPADSCINFESPHITRDQIARIEKTGAKVIPLTQGKVAIVDPDDYGRLCRYKWHAVKSNRSYYAVRSANGKSVRMHRLITNAPKGLVVDHINHNGLDNRKQNMRLCTRAENNRNSRSFCHKTSNYKGVFKEYGSKKFRAYIRFNKKSIHIGMFELEIDAAKAYDKKAKELFGEFAYLNFPS